MRLLVLLCRILEVPTLRNSSPNIGRENSIDNRRHIQDLQQIVFTPPNLPFTFTNTNGAYYQNVLPSDVLAGNPNGYFFYYDSCIGSGFYFNDGSGRPFISIYNVMPNDPSAWPVTSYDCNFPSPVPSPGTNPGSSDDPTPAPSTAPGPFRFSADNYFSPNGDNLEDTSHIVIESDASYGEWKLTIEETGQTVMSGVGNRTFDWDGSVDLGLEDEGSFFAGAGTLILTAPGQESQEVEFLADGSATVQVAAKFPIGKILKALFTKSTKKKPKPKPKPSVDPSSLKKVANLYIDLEKAYVIAQANRGIRRLNNPTITTRDRSQVSVLEATELGLAWIGGKYVVGDAGHWYEQKSGIKFYRKPKVKSYSNGELVANYCATRHAFIDDPWFNAHLYVH